MSNHGCDCCGKIRLVPRRVIFEKTGNKVWSVPQDGWYKVYVTGGGGGSGSINLDVKHLPSYPQYTTWNSGCGAAGGTAIKDLYLKAGDKIHLTVGIGGHGGALSDEKEIYNAGSGSNSSFGDYLSATGGSGGFSMGLKVTYQLHQGSGCNLESAGQGIDGDLNFNGSSGFTGGIWAHPNNFTNNVGGGSYWGFNPTPSNCGVYSKGYIPQKPKTWGNGADGAVAIQRQIGEWYNTQCVGADGADGVVVIEWFEFH